MEILNVSREDFPKSTAHVEGMKVISPVCDNYEIRIEFDIGYIKRDSGELYLQILTPINPSRKTPLIVFIPGSAFRKQDVKSRIPQLSLWAARGYAVALLEYRGSETAPFPAQVLDAKAGIVFMKEHAEKYNIDPEKIIVMGDSSGGYTALMAGVTSGVSELEENLSTKFNANVYKIVDFYGPTNIETMNDAPSSQNHILPDSPEGCLIGGKNVLENPELVYPTVVKNYISKDRDIPPILMFHGSNDELVPFEQSCELFEVLKSMNKEAQLYQIENAHHGDREFWSKTVLDIVEDFIR